MTVLSENLRDSASKYRKDARKLRIEALFRKYGPISAIGFFFILVIYYRFF